LQNFEDLSVLVVEDEAIIAMLIEDMLFEIGCKRVERAANVATGLEFLAHRVPDFAILDINLDGDRSYPVADALHARRIPFVFLSGYGIRGVERPYRMFTTLQKPFQTRDLESVLRHAFPAMTPGLRRSDVDWRME
jgi:CheY-like chemotaxis protein